MFPSPVPPSAYLGAPDCRSTIGAMKRCAQIPDDGYKPLLVVPPEIRAFDPAWASCEPNLEGMHDPPVILSAVGGLAATTPAAITLTLPPTPGPTLASAIPPKTSAVLGASGAISPGLHDDQASANSPSEFTSGGSNPPAQELAASKPLGSAVYTISLIDGQVLLNGRVFDPNGIASMDGHQFSAISGGLVVDGTMTLAMPKYFQPTPQGAASAVDLTLDPIGSSTRVRSRTRLLPSIKITNSIYAASGPTRSANAKFPSSTTSGACRTLSPTALLLPLLLLCMIL